jgi:hypothetical protein
METALLAAAIVAAGLACPAMMWWQRRRGRAAACATPLEKEPSETVEDLEELHRRHAVLAARIAELRCERATPRA